MTFGRWWHGGRLRTAAQIGVPAGAYFGAFQFGQLGSAEAALFGGLFFGLFVGVFFEPLMATIVRRSWPGAADLASADRVEVARVVQRGEAINEPRLASAVIAYAGVVRSAQERNRRQLWVLAIPLAALVAFAIAQSIGGPPRSAIVDWIMVGILVGMVAIVVPMTPRIRRGILSRAERAEQLARQSLQEIPGT
jgi:fatty acid desaturase